MHKTINKMTPQYLQEMFTFKENDYRDSDLLVTVVHCCGIVSQDLLDQCLVLLYG